MLLSVDMAGTWRYPESRHDVDGILVELAHGGGTGDAWFCFAAEKCTEDNLVPCAYLHASVDADKGFGALIWGLTQGFASVGPPGVWVSDNPNPVSSDAAIAADPSSASLHDYRNVLPVSQVLAAVDEFCRTGTGGRPTGSAWVEGHLDGQRAHDS